MGGKRQKTGVSGGRTTLSKLKGAARTSYIAARKVVKVKKSQGAPIVRRSMRGMVMETSTRCCRCLLGVSGRTRAWLSSARKTSGRVCWSASSGAG